MTAQAREKGSGEFAVSAWTSSAVSYLVIKRVCCIVHCKKAISKRLVLSLLHGFHDSNVITINPPAPNLLTNLLISRRSRCTLLGAFFMYKTEKKRGMLDRGQTPLSICQLHP